MLGSTTGYPYGGLHTAVVRHRPQSQGGGADRGKTVTKPFVLDGLGLSLSEKQIPQVVENLGSGDKSREALEIVALRVKQAL